MSEKGDRGITQGECLLDVNKNSAFTEAVGMIDEFQARLGLARVVIEEKRENEKIYKIQKDLSEVMGSLYLGTNWDHGKKRIEEINNDAEIYKKRVEEKKKRVEDLTNFLVPGKNEVESNLNSCRTGCRTAERRLKTLQLEREERESLDFDENILKYFNRLSCLLDLMWRSKF